MRTPDEVGKSIEKIIEAMNSISLEELDDILQSIKKDEALGPMLDPTAWQAGGFEITKQIWKVIKAIQDFKAKVSGIGNFA